MNSTFAVLLTTVVVAGVLAETVYGSNCNPGKLAVYKVILRTAWSREIFPKQYPEWRPSAQWSKLVGLSHNDAYRLFRLGEPASEGLKFFAEKGETNALDRESQGDEGILDAFSAPPVFEGVGETVAQFFVDGNHSKTSMVSRIVPSPDWFIGVDSLDLCVEGKWVESVILEVDPLDAGTDKGFTFTSPNWPSIPRKPIARITSQLPAHPANSFYYPERLEHPPIATFQLIKLKEYELFREFNLPSLVPHPASSRRNYVTQAARSHGDDLSNDIIPPSSLPGSSKGTHAFFSSYVDKYHKTKFKKNKRARKMAARRRPRNCRVGDWSPWSSCSTTCNIGEMIRKRIILKHPRRDGRPCPRLEEKRWCGSSRDCDHKYFDW